MSSKDPICGRQYELDQVDRLGFELIEVGQISDLTLT